MTATITALLALGAGASTYFGIQAAHTAHENDMPGDRLTGCLFALLFAGLAALCYATILHVAGV